MIPTNTHILFHEFEYLEPRSIGEVMQLLAEHGTDARVMAGGTDLLVQMKIERQHPEFVISLDNIPNLNHIFVNGSVELGATTTIRSIYKSAVVQQHYTALAEACNWFSTVQIMNMATIGGNLCNASPAADTAPPLLAFDAQVKLVSRSGEHQLPLEKFFVGPGKTVMRPEQLLVSVYLPPQPANSGSAFIKIARVAADLSKTCAVVKIVRDGYLVRECRIALGAVAPTPMRARKAEAALVGQPFSNELAEHAAQIASAEIKPITDVRSTREYRQQVSAVIVRDALLKAWERA